MLKNKLMLITGQRVIYCRAGGGAASIMRLEFQNRNEIWLWRYWEIFKNGVLLATAVDDITAVVGPIARAALELENKVVEDVHMEGLNFMLTFSQGCVLKVFCEYDNEIQDLPHWEYWLPSEDKSYTITAELKIEEGEYDGRSRDKKP